MLDLVFGVDVDVDVDVDVAVDVVLLLLRPIRREELVVTW